MYKSAIAGVVAIVALILTALAGWVTHVIVCIQAAQWILLAFGAIVVPIGVIHGWGCWFGWWN